MTDTFIFEQQARSRRTLVIVLGVWTVLIAAWVWLDAAWWIMALDAQTLSWFSGRRQGALEVSEIEHIRLDTRLDFSVRVTAVLTTGRKIRLPFESTPPHQTFENALLARGVKTQRHHFQLLQ